MNDHDLEAALRALPPREGRSDWADLERRLSALRPARPARRLRRRILSSAAAGLVLAAAGYAAWRVLLPPAETTWTDAHEAAATADPWADPWVVAAVESSR